MWCYWAKITSIPLLLNPVEKYKWIMYFNVGLTNSFIFFSFQWLSYTFVIFSFATSSTLKVCECTAKVGRVLLCWEIWLDSLSIENEWRAVHPTFNWPKRASTSREKPGVQRYRSCSEENKLFSFCWAPSWFLSSGFGSELQDLLIHIQAELCWYL